jgi:hypothetical protein
VNRSIHIPTQPDLFNIAEDDPLIGLRMRLDRAVDQRAPCHDNVVEVCSGKGPHGHALLCEACGKFRGWLPKAAAAAFIHKAIRMIGVPDEPLIYRDQSSTVVGADGEINAIAPKRSPIMDMSKYAGSSFLGLDDVQDGPVRGHIAHIEEGQFGRPVITFENGLKFSLNVTNTVTLLKAFGSESDDLLGEQIELFAGETTYNNEAKPSVLVRAIAREPGVEKKKVTPKRKPGGDMDDEVPF